MRNAVSSMRPIARLSSPAARRAFATSRPHLAAAAAAATTPSHAQSNSPGETAPLNPRWLSELQTRIKRCASLGLQGTQKAELEAVQKAVDGRWLELLAGREGFLTGPGWRGLDRHTVTWGDQDAMEPAPGAHSLTRLQGHVNNVVYNKYAESARFNWLSNFATTIDPEHADEWNAFMTPKDVGLIMRSIKTDYKFPMAYPDNVTVLHKLTSKPDHGSDYILLEALLISHRFRRPAARCFEDIVVYDYKTAKRTALKPYMVDKLRETYDAQDRCRAETEERVRELVGVVDRLERAA